MALNGKEPHHDDEEANIHDQLPSVEDIRMASQRSSPKPSVPSVRRCRIGRCGEISLIALVAILIAAVIGLSIGVANRGDQVAAATAAGSESGAPPATARDPREAAVRTFLNDQGISDLDEMSQASSPHKFAVTWIADIDELYLPIPESIESPDGVRFVTRYIVALIFFMMGGELWEHQLSFLSEKDVCEWNDIFVAAQGVQGRFFRIGIACNNGIVNTWQMRKSLWCRSGSLTVNVCDSHVISFSFHTL